MSGKQEDGGPNIPDDARDLGRLRAIKVDPEAVISKELQKALVDVDEKLNGEKNPIAKIVGQTLADGSQHVAYRPAHGRPPSPSGPDTSSSSSARQRGHG